MGRTFPFKKARINFKDKIQALKMMNFFLMHTGKPPDMTYALYTEAQVRAIHRNFRNPSIRGTEGLLRRAQEGRLDTSTRDSTAQIAANCKMCMIHATAPRRVKLTVGADELRFNHSVQCDAMFTTGKPVLRMVDVVTYFCATTLLRSQSTK